MLLDRAFGNSQSFGHLAVRHFLDPVQHENLPRPFGKLLQQGPQAIEPLARAVNLLRARQVFGDPGQIVVRGGIGPLEIGPPDMIGRQIAGGSIEVRAIMDDGCIGPLFGKTQEGLLGEIIRHFPIAQSAGQIGMQFATMCEKEPLEIFANQSVASQLDNPKGWRRTYKR